LHSVEGRRNMLWSQYRIALNPRETGTVAQAREAKAD
jgi:hypothetical protein